MRERIITCSRTFMCFGRGKSREIERKRKRCLRFEPQLKWSCINQTFFVFISIYITVRQTVIICTASTKGKHRTRVGSTGPPIHPLPYGQREYPFNESEPDAPQLCLKKQDSIVRPLHLSPAVPSSERIPIPKWW